jgi:outer membrane protein assembly factor BamD (BamD/ComL family)
MKSYEGRLLIKLLLGSLLIFTTLLSIYTFIYIKGKCLETKANFYFQKGTEFLYKGDYKNAIRNFDEAGRLCPKLYGEVSKDIITSLKIVEQLHEWGKDP